MFNHNLLNIELSARYDYLTNQDPSTKRNIEREFSKPSRPTGFLNQIRFFN